MAKQASRKVKLTQKQIRERDTCLSCPVPGGCVEIGHPACPLYKQGIPGSNKYQAEWNKKKRAVEKAAQKAKESIWVVIRPAEFKDYLALEMKARAFMKRHEMSVPATFAVKELEAQIEAQRYAKKQLKRNWKAVVGRALGDKRAEGIRDGQVGFLSPCQGRRYLTREKK